MTPSETLWPRSAGPLTLRQPTEDGLDQVLTWRNDPEVTRWLIKTTVDPVEMKANWLEDRPDYHSVIAYAGDQVVGTGSLWIDDATGQRHTGADIWERAQGGIGYLIDPAYAGNGYATHLARELLSVGFELLGLHRITAGCFADNTASWKVMEKLGMRREEHAVKDSWHADLGWVDGYTYAILADEWPTPTE